jgi:4-hydroxy-tetrahydrodipicolinate reductase
MIKVALIGVGRTGSLVAKSLVESKCSLVAAFAAPKDASLGRDIGILAGLKATGIKVSSSKDLAKVLDDVKPDVLVDFSSADAFMQNLGVVTERKINMVVGTTGFTESQLAEIKKTVDKHKIGMVFSPNMSVGVNVFWQLCREAAKNLKGYDVEIIDKHHRFKKDAPSGTALKAAQVIAEAQGLRQQNFVYGRRGASLRREGDIGIHAIRAGNIVGEHTVIFASQTERVELSHIANSREAFASGVPKAVEFIKGRKGLFDMKDVLNM